jgi:hypothetical protein
MKINVFPFPSPTVRNSMLVFKICLIYLFAVGVFSANKSYGQTLRDGFYVGLEDMISVSPDKPKLKWYHLTHLTIKGDSVWVHQSPISIYKHDTVWSSSDGGFYSYKGKITIRGGQFFINLKMTKCDYCPVPIDTLRHEKITHKVMNGRVVGNGMEIEGHFFVQTKSRDEG